MNKKQLDNLSASLSKAINPAARKIEATAKILERIEPLPIVSKPTHEVAALAAVGEVDCQADRFPHEESVDAFVKNTMAKMTTVAKSEPSPWPMATVVKSATVAELPTHDNLTTAESLDNLANLANLADVKGELRVPNTIVDSLLPTLEPAAALVYLRLYRLSHGYRRDTCLVGLQKLATATNTSQRTVQRAIEYLERRYLILREGASFGGKIKGIQFRVKVPGSPATQTSVDKTATVAKMTTDANLTRRAQLTTLATLATNKDDDLLNASHHQRETRSGFPQSPPAEPQEQHAARRESTSHLGQTATSYTTITKNPWLQTDTDSYFQYRVDQIPIEKVTAVIQAVFQRAESRINSFSYFVKEIVASMEKRTAGGRRRKLAAILHRVRENHIGSAQCSISDLVFDVKTACAREGVVFDNDLFNQLITGKG
jgi:helix-turn-helix protein